MLKNLDPSVPSREPEKQATGENPLKDYYKILGLEEGATIDELTARWLELKKQFGPGAKGGNKANLNLREINEAYRILKSSIPRPYAFDIDEYIKKHSLRKKKEEGRRWKRRISLSSGILALCLIIVGTSIFISQRLQLDVQLKWTSPDGVQQKTEGPVEQIPLPDPLEPRSLERVTEAIPQGPGKPVLPESFTPVAKEPGVEAAKPPLKELGSPERVIQAMPQGPSKPVLPESSRPVARAFGVEAGKPGLTEPSAGSIPGAEALKPKEKPAKPPDLKPETPVQAAKLIPPAPEKKGVPEKVQPASKTAGKVEAPKPIFQEPYAGFLADFEARKAKEKPPTPPVSKSALLTEVGKAVRQEFSEGAHPEKTKPVPEGDGRVETPEPMAQKPPVASPARTEELQAKNTSPVELANVVPQKQSRASISDDSKPAAPPTPPASVTGMPAPALKPLPPLEKEKEVPRETGRITGPDNARIASLPTPPPAIASEQEVRDFFANYVIRYNRKEVEKFISFFSPKAVQNQKDDVSRIQKTTQDFFDQLEAVRYQLAISKIEPHQDRVEVRAQYELEGILMKGRKSQTWKGQIRWVLVRENGALKILSLDYQPQPSK